MAEVLSGIKNPVLKRGYHRMTCAFGVKRTYINTSGKKVTDTHNGIDLTGNTNVDDGYDYVIAFADGKVVSAAFSTSCGYFVKLDHGNGIYTRYMHMKRGSLTVTDGKTVKKGQVLGYMGETGNVTGRHLHFDITIDGNKVDPLPYLKGQKSFTSNIPINNTTYTVKSAVNIRTGPSTSYQLAKCSELPKGLRVSVSSEVNSYLKTPFGWIHKNYAKKIGVIYEITKPVNVRTGAGVNYALKYFTELPKGVSIQVLKSEGVWGNIGIGWVNLNYLLLS